jgi:hypothetical protein
VAFIVCFDAGSSLIKIIWENLLNGDRKVRYLVMSPYEAEIIRVPRYEDDVSLERIWIKYGDRQFALGQIARDEYANSRLSLSERKYERAVRRVLGVLGYFAKIEHLDWGTPIHLGLLLPFDEYQDKETVEYMLRQYVEEYVWCGEVLRFNLKTIACRPEGFGLYSQCGNFSVGRSLTTVLGHRDATALIAENQMPHSRSETVPLGLNNMIQYVRQDFAIKDEMVLTRALFDAGYPLDEEPLKQLIQVSDPGIASYELARLKSVVETAREQYCFSVKQWLTKHLSDIDEILVCGGTALYLQSELQQWCKGFTLNWCDRLIKSMIRHLGIKLPSQQHRLIDPYGMFLHLKGSIKQ